MAREFITVTENDSGQRIDKFCLKSYAKLTKAGLYKLIRKKDLRLNGLPCKGNEMLKKGDIVRIWLPDDIVNYGNGKRVVYSDIPLDVIYEDDNIIIVFKPDSIDVHTGAGNDDTMIARLYSHLKYTAENEHSFSPAFANRLDRNTSGILIAAKNAQALREINECIRDDMIKKEYIAICIGSPENKSGTLVKYQTESDGNTVCVSDEPIAGYKKTITQYKVIAEAGNLSLVKIELITGRKHQIRATFAHIGNPVLGDPKYGSDTFNKIYHANKQLLCAYRILFEPNDEMKLSYLKNKTFEVGLERIPEKIRDIFEL